MTDLTPPSKDGTLTVVYPDSDQGAGERVHFDDVVGYSGDAKLVTIHFTDGSTVECHDIAAVETP